MLLLGDEVVTLVKHIKGETDSYKCYSMSGVSWYQRTTITTSGDGAKPSNSYTARIPADQMPTGVVPDLGDYLVKGVITAVEKPTDITGSKFRITAVGANNRGRLPHWRCDGQ